MLSSVFSTKNSQPMRLDCSTSLMVPVRSEPTSKGKITRHLHSGTVVEVKVKESKGFYELADGSVSDIIIEINNHFILFNYIYDFI